MTGNEMKALQQYLPEAFEIKPIKGPNELNS